MKFIVSLNINKNSLPVQFFETFEDATTFINNNSNPSFQIFQCTQDDNMIDDESYDYNLETYGLGYILTTSEENPLYGEKYFDNKLVDDFEGTGYWNNKANGWFFKKNNLEALHSFLDQGVSDNENNESDISNMYLKEYEKGYLLVPNEENDTRIGTKYFLGGCWKPNKNAWFFNMEHYEYLVYLGAQTIESSAHIYHPMDNTTFEKYGKGYMVYPNDNHPSFGEKYFHNGWWFPKNNGWFFKNDAFNCINS